MLFKCYEHRYNLTSSIHPFFFAPFVFPCNPQYGFSTVPFALPWRRCGAAVDWKVVKTNSLVYEIIQANWNIFSQLFHSPVPPFHLLVGLTGKCKSLLSLELNWRNNGPFPSLLLICPSHMDAAWSSICRYFWFCPSKMPLLIIIICICTCPFSQKPCRQPILDKERPLIAVALILISRLYEVIIAQTQSRFITIYRHEPRFYANKNIYGVFLKHFRATYIKTGTEV